MTNHWVDIGHANAVLIMGSNAAEHHPISFKWVLRAKDKGATVIHVDPKFSRTSSKANFHVPLRSGTDIAFLGGMMKYILEKEKYFKEYVVEYTNASFLVNEKFGFDDGAFTGLDEAKKVYDKSSWTFINDDKGVPLKDRTLQDKRCVFQLLKKHYSRYSLDKVSSITGVSQKDLMRVYETFAATGKPNKAGTMMYALGWTQHTYGVQIIRLACMIQLMLGNIGVPGGGINALRGEPNVQGSTDHALLYDNLPGYHAVPRTSWPTLADYIKAGTPVTNDPKSANWWSNRSKYVVSLLKGWFGEAATAENEFGYPWLSKLEPGEDCSVLYVYDRMLKNQVKGGFIFAHNPCQSIPNSHKVRRAMENLDWAVFAELHHSESTDFWRGPKAKPTGIKTEVFLLPSAERGEKDGTTSNSGRWHIWHHKAIEPMGDSKPMGWMMVEIMKRVRTLYAQEGGAFPAPILNLDWYEAYDPDLMSRKINGWYTRDTKIGDKEFKKGGQVPLFPSLTDDGSTVSLNWLYCGAHTDEGNHTKRRDLTQTPMQAKLGLFPKYVWSWPANRRILYNRASVDKNGKPWNPDLPVILWEDGKWVGDVPDGAYPPLADEKGKYPFIMHKEGHSQLFGPGLADGPFPEHYEPIETPVTKHPFSKRMHNPLAKIMSSDMDPLAKPGDPRFPVVLTTYVLTEHWCAGGHSRNTPVLLEAEPQIYCEMSHELADQIGVKNGEVVEVESLRGKVQAVAMVTVRIRPFTVQGKTVHLIGIPYCFGWATPKCGDAVNRLTPSVGDANTGIPEYKACLVNIRKCAKVTEL